jgi:tRNA(fMet)-specific endonuclease VapC
MILLDTDHISVLQHADSRAAAALQERLVGTPDPEVGTTAITLEEQARSWLALISRSAEARLQVPYYARFVAGYRFFAKWRVLPFDDAAATRFQWLRSTRVRISSSDLKIAAICLANDATLLSRNTFDFLQVPGLRVENWLQD